MVLMILILVIILLKGTCMWKISIIQWHESYKGLYINDLVLYVHTFYLDI